MSSQTKLVPEETRSRPIRLLLNLLLLMSNRPIRFRKEDDMSDRRDGDDQRRGRC